MKKIICLLLALLMVFSLFACGSGSDTDDGSGTAGDTSTSADNSGDAVAGTDNVADAGTEAGGDTVPTLMTAEEKEAAVKAMFGEGIDMYPEFLSLFGGDIGYISDDVDHSARDTYKVAFVGSSSSAASKNITNGLRNYQTYFNYTLEESYSDGDVDKYITLLETYALNGIDGFLLNPDNNVFPRIKEVCDELEIPYVFILTPYKDENGYVQVPSVGENDYTDGVTVFNWLLDNYKAKWGDVDLSKVGVIGLYWSTNIPMTTRVKAAEDIWKEQYPEYADNFFYVDTAAQSNGVSQEAAYNEISAFVSAHPEYDYWLISSAAGLFANGASRAIEGLNLDANTLICSVGIEELINQWNAGYEGCWGGCVAIDSEIYGLPMIAGLIALMDGRATQETLWQEHKNEGDIAAYYIVEATVITRDAYLDYADDCGVIKAYFAG